MEKHFTLYMHENCDLRVPCTYHLLIIAITSDRNYCYYCYYLLPDLFITDVTIIDY